MRKSALGIMQNAFLDALAAVVGERHILTDAGATAAYFSDWRKHYRAAAECVARPADADQVAAIVRLCAREGGAGGRLGADWRAARDRAFARAPEPYPRARCARRHGDRGSRLRAGASAAGGAGCGPLLPGIARP